MNAYYHHTHWHCVRCNWVAESFKTWWRVWFSETNDQITSWTGLWGMEMKGVRPAQCIRYCCQGVLPSGLSEYCSLADKSRLYHRPLLYFNQVFKLYVSIHNISGLY